MPTIKKHLGSVRVRKLLHFSIKEIITNKKKLSMQNNKLQLINRISGESFNSLYI